jgi:FkbM family methyltransferase
MLQLLGSAECAWTFETDGLDKNSIVYSFGVADDATWDVAMIEKFGCEVHAFDMTPDSITWVSEQTLPPQFHFHPHGIADFDGMQTFHLLKKPNWARAAASTSIFPKTEGTKLPVKRLATIMKELGHQHIDVLKMDIEGDEYDVLRDIGDIPIRQVLVELHIKNKSQLLLSWLARARMFLRGYKLVKLRDGHDFTFIRPI